MEERFAADRNLGTLAKWLRILGYDTSFDRAGMDQDFLEKAAQEGRIVLTRKRAFARLSYPGRLVVLSADRVGEQLGEILGILALEPDPARRMSRCLICNSILEEVSREAVEGVVPVYVYESCRQYRRCLLCGRIFWPGTHPRKVEEFLKRHVPSRRP